MYRSRGIVRRAGVVGLLCCWAALPSVAQTPLINEFVVNHTGADTFEFVEIVGMPATNYGDWTLLQVSGAPGEAGTILTLFDIGKTDAAGYWSTGFQTNEFIDEAITLLLVRGFSGDVGHDLDTNDNGLIDESPWLSVGDAIAVAGAGGRTYATTLVTNFSGSGATTPPGGASRIPNGVDTNTAADWVENDFDGAGLPGFAGTLAAGEAYHTPGGPNALTPPEPEGEPTCSPVVHSADTSGNLRIELPELLRVIQLFNSPRFGCGGGSVDGYAPGAENEACCPHASDYSPQDWRIGLPELLRLIQFFNSGGYVMQSGTADGYAPGLP